MYTFEALTIQKLIRKLFYFLLSKFYSHDKFYKNVANNSKVSLDIKGFCCENFNIFFDSFHISKGL
ncbi:MAG: hypothetical protein AYK18_03635 [Theionarchaea archaeon DG-70]|nr:MAG: hypothetical protein AYK18_03635 [Theionarchaea archaeon DG-70]